MCACMCVCTGVYIHAHVRFVKTVNKNQCHCIWYKPSLCVYVCVFLCAWCERVCVCKDTVGRCVAGNNASA